MTRRKDPDPAAGTPRPGAPTPPEAPEATPHGEPGRAFHPARARLEVYDGSNAAEVLAMFGIEPGDAVMVGATPAGGPVIIKARELEKVYEWRRQERRSPAGITRIRDYRRREETPE